MLQLEQSPDIRLPRFLRRAAIAAGVAAFGALATVCVVAEASPEKSAEPKAVNYIVGNVAILGSMGRPGFKQFSPDKEYWRVGVCDGPTFVINHFGEDGTSGLEVTVDSPRCRGAIQEHREGTITYSDDFTENNIKVRCLPGWEHYGLREYTPEEEFFGNGQKPIVVPNQPAC